MTAFLEGIQQHPVEVDDIVLDTPVLYEDAGAWMGLFPAKLGALRKLLAPRGLKPARLAPGAGIVGVVGYDYRGTPVGPYLEVGILIALTGLVKAQRTGHSEWYVHWLPVDRPEAAKGEEIWGLPSPVLSIGRAGDGTWSLSDDAGPILALHCRSAKTRARNGKVMTSKLHTRTQSFDVKLNVLEEAAVLGGARLTIAEEHPRGRELADMLLSRRAIATSIAPRSESILYLPDGSPAAVASPAEALP